VGSYPYDALTNAAGIYYMDAALRSELDGNHHSHNVARAELKSGEDGKTHVLVVYANDMYDQIKQLAGAIGDGASSVGASVRVLAVSEANYKRDVFEWADAVVVGSGVFNGNAAPIILEFINSFDFEDNLSMKVGGSFATGGAAVGGLELAIESLNRGLRTFGILTAGGTNWKNVEGTGVVTNGSESLDSNSESLALARNHGSRLAQLAARLKPAPAPVPPKFGSPPSWGENWTAVVSANLTNVGYDAGLVIVNFSGSCASDPRQQKMRTVYGDFDTVLTRCDLKREFIIDPPSRGGTCRSRVIGEDVDARICEACSCPFCVRDTNGSFTHGEHFASKTVWETRERKLIAGEEVLLWSGVAASIGASNFNLKTSIAYSTSSLDGSLIPRFVNVSHPLWTQTAARIDNFSRSIDVDVFAIPKECFRADQRPFLISV
jgi:NAD(P)H dehydrogenase (quinone)